MTVSIGFDVKPLEAINYFKNKGLKTTFSYADMIAADHVNNFTIAKMMDMDLLQDMYDSLLQAQKKGWTLQQWKDRMIPHLQANGWWGRQAVKDPITGKTIVSELGSSRRLDIIFRTNMQMAYMAGQWQQIKEQERIAPYLMYNAVDDYRTREEHRANDNKIYPVSHPFWFTHYPPCGFACRCTTIQLSKSDLEDFGYEVSPDTPIEYKDWKNPRTGLIEKIPVGTDAGFNFNAGQARYEQLQQLAKEKAQAIKDKAMREAAEEALVKIGMEAKRLEGGIMANRAMQETVKLTNTIENTPNSVGGTAYLQKVKPRDNAELYGEAIRRTPDEAKAILEKVFERLDIGWGTLEEYKFVMLREEQYQWFKDFYQMDDFFASYGNLRTDKKAVRFNADIRRDGVISVFVHESVFDSDESILQIFHHEMYEIEELRYLAASAITIEQYWNHVRPDKADNLHHKAVLESDKILLEYRSLIAQELKNEK